MNSKFSKLKPAVNRQVLLFLAGIMWFGVGTMLVIMACSWLAGVRHNTDYLFFGIGAAAALIIHHLGFLKIVDKNLGRLLPVEGTQCVFSFMPWKSYVIIVVMITMGNLLRHSAIPKPYLSVLYTGIGLALILSSIRYLRIFLGQCIKGE